MLDIKCYIINYSTVNEHMFEELKRNNFVWKIVPFEHYAFEICFLVEVEEISHLEEIMKWYV